MSSLTTVMPSMNCDMAIIRLIIIVEVVTFRIIKSLLDDPFVKLTVDLAMAVAKFKQEKIGLILLLQMFVLFKTYLSGTWWSSLSSSSDSSITWGGGGLWCDGGGPRLWGDP